MFKNLMIVEGKNVYRLNRFFTIGIDVTILIIGLIEVIDVQADKSKKETIHKNFKEEAIVILPIALPDMKRDTVAIQGTEAQIDIIRKVLGGEILIVRDVITVNMGMIKTQIIIDVITAKGRDKTIQNKDQGLGNIKLL